MPPWSTCRDTLCLTPGNFTLGDFVRYKTSELPRTLDLGFYFGSKFSPCSVFPLLNFGGNSIGEGALPLPAVTTTTVRQQGPSGSHRARDTWTPLDSAQKMLYLGGLLLEIQDGLFATRRRRLDCSAQASRRLRCAGPLRFVFPPQEQGKFDGTFRRVSFIQFIATCRVHTGLMAHALPTNYSKHQADDDTLSHSIGTRSTKTCPREPVAFFVLQADLWHFYLQQQRCIFRPAA